MATVGGVLMTICTSNLRGDYNGNPWNWPSSPNCQALYDELHKRNVAPEELSFGNGRRGGSLNSVGEYVAAAGASNVSALVDAALAKGAAILTAERSIPFAITDRLRYPGIGNIERTTIAPISRPSEFAGGDISIMQRAFEGLPPAVAEALLKRLLKADRDGRLGIFTPTTARLLGGF